MPEALSVTPATGPPHVVGEQITVLAPGFRTDDYLPLGGSGRWRTTARTRHQRAARRAQGPSSYLVGMRPAI
jgi:hypothetical protein